MVHPDYRAPERLCTSRLFWVWGAYAMATCWLWNGLTAAGFSATAIWAVAGLAGAAVLLATREL